MKTKNQYTGIRWTARVVGTLLVLFTLFILIGEMIDGYHRNGKIDLETFNILQIITFIFWFLGLAVTDPGLVERRCWRYSFVYLHGHFPYSGKG